MNKNYIKRMKNEVRMIERKRKSDRYSKVMNRRRKKGLLENELTKESLVKLSIYKYFINWLEVKYNLKVTILPDKTGFFMTSDQFSFNEFKIDKNEQFLYGLWIYEVDEGYLLELFGQFEEEIDKFKPSRSQFCVNLGIVNKDLSNIKDLEKIDLDKPMNASHYPDENTVFSWSWKYPEVAYSMDVGELHYLSFRDKEKYFKMELEDYLRLAKKDYKDYIDMRKESRVLLTELGNKIELDIKKYLNDKKYVGEFKLWNTYNFYNLYYSLDFNVYTNETKKVKQLSGYVEDLEGIIDYNVKRYRNELRGEQIFNVEGLGMLYLKDSIIYYDGHLIFTAQDIYENVYLLSKSKDEEFLEEFIVNKLSEEQYTAFKGGVVSTKDLYENNKGDLFLIEIIYDDEVVKVTIKKPRKSLYDYITKSDVFYKNIDESDKRKERLNKITYTCFISNNFPINITSSKKRFRKLKRDI